MFIGEKMKLFSRLFIISAILCGVLLLSGCISPRSKCLADAEDGDAKAQGLLGSIFLTGNGSAINYSEAYYWLRLGAANGDSLAAYYLGIIINMDLAKSCPTKCARQDIIKAFTKTSTLKLKKEIWHMLMFSRKCIITDATLSRINKLP